MLAFAERNVRVKYKQTLLGALWVVLQPLAFMVVFTVALGRLADVPSAGTTYEAFSLSAFVSWSFVQNAVTQGANSLVADAAFLRKVYFPREVPVLAAQLSAAVDFGVGLLVFFVLGPILGADVAITWLLAPLLFVGLFVLATRRVAAAGRAQRLLPGLPQRAAVPDAAVAVRLAGRLPGDGDPGGVAAALRAGRTRRPGGSTACAAC